eukprot:jgi/Botrbrau1/2394/Bobra.0395s0026.1
MSWESPSPHHPSRGKSWERPVSANTTSAFDEESEHTESIGKNMLMSAIPLSSVLPVNQSTLRVETEPSSVTNTITTTSANTSSGGSGEVVVNSRLKSLEDGPLNKRQKRSSSPAHNAAKKPRLGTLSENANNVRHAGCLGEAGPSQKGEHNLGENFPFSETGSPAPEQAPRTQPASQPFDQNMQAVEENLQHRNSVGPTVGLQPCDASQNHSPEASERPALKDKRAQIRAACMRYRKTVGNRGALRKPANESGPPAPVPLTQSPAVRVGLEVKNSLDSEEHVELHLSVVDLPATTHGSPLKEPTVADVTASAGTSMARGSSPDLPRGLACSSFSEMIKQQQALLRDQVAKTDKFKEESAAHAARATKLAKENLELKAELRDFKERCGQAMELLKQKIDETRTQAMNARHSEGLALAELQNFQMSKRLMQDELNRREQIIRNYKDIIMELVQSAKAQIAAAGGTSVGKLGHNLPGSGGGGPHEGLTASTAGVKSQGPADGNTSAATRQTHKSLIAIASGITAHPEAHRDELLRRLQKSLTGVRPNTPGRPAPLPAQDRGVSPRRLQEGTGTRLASDLQGPASGGGQGKVAKPGGNPAEDPHDLNGLLLIAEAAATDEKRNEFLRAPKSRPRTRGRTNPSSTVAEGTEIVEGCKPLRETGTSRAAGGKSAFRAVSHSSKRSAPFSAAPAQASRMGTTAAGASAPTGTGSRLGAAGGSEKAQGHARMKEDSSSGTGEPAAKRGRHEHHLDNAIFHQRANLRDHSGPSERRAGSTRVGKPSD